MLYYFFIIALIASNTNPWCSCIPPGKITEEQYNEYAVILKGKVIKINEARWERTLTVKADIYYKGTQTKDTIKIISPASSGECGIFPKTGEDWLFFAYERNSKLETHLCTRTKTMNSKAWDYRKEELEDDLNFLETKRNSSLLRNVQ